MEIGNKSGQDVSRERRCARPFRELWQAEADRFGCVSGMARDENSGV